MASDSENSAKQMKDLITSLLISTPRKITIDNLCRDYREMIGSDIPYKEFGYTSVYDYLYSISDTVTIKGHGKYAIVEPVIKEKSKHINQLVMKQRVTTPKGHLRQKSNSHNFNGHINGGGGGGGRRSLPARIAPPRSDRIPLEVQNNLRKLIELHPHGLLYSTLSKKYEETFNQKLRPEDYDYRSLQEMCEGLKSIFHCKNLSTVDVMFFNSITNLITSSNDEEKKFTKINWNTNLIPNNVHIFDKIPRQTLPKIGDKMNCEITEIFNPSKFFIFIRNNPFKQLEDKLHKFFNLEHHNYQIPEILLREGLYCVVNVTQYCRAIIINTKIQHKIKVLLIDYGFVTTIDSNLVYYLPKVFGRLPAQAIECKLFNLNSVNNSNWSVDCLKRFKELTSNQQTFGEVMKVDNDKHVLEINLIGHQMINVNKFLIDEDFAVEIITDLLSKTL